MQNQQTIELAVNSETTIEAIKTMIHERHTGRISTDHFKLFASPNRQLVHGNVDGYNIQDGQVIALTPLSGKYNFVLGTGRDSSGRVVGSVFRIDADIVPEVRELTLPMNVGMRVAVVEQGTNLQFDFPVEPSTTIDSLRTLIQARVSLTDFVLVHPPNSVLENGRTLSSYNPPHNLFLVVVFSREFWSSHRSVNFNIHYRNC
jgi:hypothetical protein